MTGETHTKVWCVYIFCCNIQYSKLVFTGIVVAASLPLVLSATGLFLKTSSRYIYSYHLHFCLLVLCLGKTTVARKHWQSCPQPARTHLWLSPKLPWHEEKNRIYFKPITWIRKLRTRYKTVTAITWKDIYRLEEWDSWPLACSK